MTDCEELKNSWKNTKVFQKQLALNLQQLDVNERKGSYPPHWIELWNVLNRFRPKTVLEIVCGIGAASEVIRRHVDFVEYNGSDYSKEAIAIAKATWGTPDKFFVQDLWELTEEIVQKYECILEGAVFDVIPNGDEALEFLLNFKPLNLYLQRMQFTDQPSYYEEYRAYDEITTVQYYHNYDNFIKMIQSCGYDGAAIGTRGTPTGFYLKRR